MKNLLSFIEQSPTAFHAVENIKTSLNENGFKELSEKEKWNLEAGKSYYVTRNQSAIIAFKVPSTGLSHFQIVAAHSDSPTFKVKENPEMKKYGHYVVLNTEKYGGMIMSTWFDRPLSVAGRALVEKGNKVESVLVNVDEDLLMIPNLAIHMNRTVNDGYTYNAQVDMLPLLGDETSNLDEAVAASLGVKKEQIKASDLFLYPRVRPCVYGVHKEYIGSPRLDDLECAYCAMEALKASDTKAISIAAVFDNEEVGSGTKQGAASTFLQDTLKRINSAFGQDDENYLTLVSKSFMISSDNAHAAHPNHGEVLDPTNTPYMNEGIVIKYSANQKYTTDAFSASIFKSVCNAAKQPYQIFTNRSNILGGSTLGNISTSQVSLNSVDVGLPQLAMHSCYETAGAKDVDSFIEILKYYYAHNVEIENDGYSIQ